MNSGRTVYIVAYHKDQLSQMMAGADVFNQIRLHAFQAFIDYVTPDELMNFTSMFDGGRAIDLDGVPGVEFQLEASQTVETNPRASRGA